MPNDTELMVLMACVLGRESMLMLELASPCGSFYSAAMDTVTAPRGDACFANQTFSTPSDANRDACFANQTFDTLPMPEWADAAPPVPSAACGQCCTREIPDTQGPHTGHQNARRSGAPAYPL